MRRSLLVYAMEVVIVLFSQASDAKISGPFQNPAKGAGSHAALLLQPRCFHQASDHLCRFQVFAGSQ